MSAYDRILDHGIFNNARPAYITRCTVQQRSAEPDNLKDLRDKPLKNFRTSSFRLRFGINVFEVFALCSDIAFHNSSLLRIYCNYSIKVGTSHCNEPPFVDIVKCHQPWAKRTRIDIYLGCMTAAVGLRFCRSAVGWWPEILPLGGELVAWESAARRWAGGLRFCRSAVGWWPENLPLGGGLVAWESAARRWTGGCL